MTKRREVVAAIAGLFLVSCIAVTAQAPTKPSAEHQRLAYFVGQWTNVGEMKPGPFGPGGKTTSTDTCEWFEGRFAVICRSEGKSPDGPTKRLGITSYSTEEKVYTYYAIDNSGTPMTTVQRGTVKGGTWTFTGGQDAKVRVTLKEMSPTSYTFMLEMQVEGKWTPMMESTSTKSK